MAINWKENYQKYKYIVSKNYESYKKREDVRSYLELVLDLTAISVFSIFAIRPTAITIIELNKEIKAREETVQKMNQKIENLQVAQRLIEENKDPLSLLDKAIPREPEAEDFIHTLGGIAALDNLAVRNISTNNITIIGEARKTDADKSKLNLPEGTNIIPFSASFTGKFTDLNEFIRKLENFLRPLAFEQLEIKSKRKEEGEGEEIKNLDLNVVIGAPYYQLTKTRPEPEEKEKAKSQNNSEEILAE